MERHRGHQFTFRRIRVRICCDILELSLHLVFQEVLETVGLAKMERFASHEVVRFLA